jgi:hypothetical protein
VFEPDFVSPYQAIQNALRCRSEVLLAEAGFPRIESFEWNRTFQSYDGDMSNLLQYASVLDVHQIPMDQFHGEHEE